MIVDIAELFFIFLIVLSPVAAMRYWNVVGQFLSRSEHTRLSSVIGLVAFVILSAAVLLGTTILDWLNIAPPTFQIAAGALLIFGAIWIFLPLPSLIRPEAVR